LASIFSGIVSLFQGMFTASLTALLQAIVPALSVSTSLFSEGVYDTWRSVLLVAYTLSSIFLIAIAYSYMSGRNIRFARWDQRSIPLFVMAVILMPFTLFMCQLVLDVNDAMTSAVMPYASLSTYSHMVVEKLGGYSLLTLILLTIIAGLLYLVLVMRTLIVFFTAALMPLIALCYTVDWTRGFAEKIIQLFAEMAFLPFFIGVAFKIGIAVSYTTMNSLQSSQLVIGGTYLLPLMIPFILSPAGSRIMQQFGLPAASTVIAGAGILGISAISYASGLVSSPVASALSRTGRIRSASSAVGSSRLSSRLTRNPMRAYSAGLSHGRIVGEQLNIMPSRLQSFRQMLNPSRFVPFRHSLLKAAERTGSRNAPHKIYSPRRENDD